MHIYNQSDSNKKKQGVGQTVYSVIKCKDIKVCSSHYLLLFDLNNANGIDDLLRLSSILFGLQERQLCLNINSFLSARNFESSKLKGYKSK
jgi:hypothetical protein